MTTNESRDPYMTLVNAYEEGKKDGFKEGVSYACQKLIASKIHCPELTLKLLEVVMSGIPGD